MPVRAIDPEESDRQRQARVLGALRAKMRRNAANPKEWDVTPTAASIGVSATQWTRYESGQTILPPPAYAAVARAFGIERDELVRLLLLDDQPPAPPAWAWRICFRI